MKKIHKLFVVSALSFLILIACIALYPIKTSAANCTPYASKQCISNIVYWYDSCGVLQSVYQNCASTNQICQNGQCVNKTITPIQPSGTTIIRHDVKSCYNGDLYWYSSDAKVQDMYQSCKDTNQCTLDNCASNQCINQLKCDGSTCAVNSPDYVKYCSNNTNQAGTIQVQASAPAISVALFASTQGNPLQLEKNINGNGNDTIDFLEVVKNTSDFAIDNVSITTDLTNNISYMGSLKIDNVSSAGNLASGIDLGTLSPKMSKVISFTGSVATQASPGVIQITSHISSSNTVYDSDYVIVTIGAKNTSNIPATTTNSGNSFINNLKNNWYIWLMIVIILLVVFVIIFRRLSSNV